MRLTHFAHSCLLVESADTRLLFDPGTLSRGFEELRDLHAIVVTHQHGDHCDVDRLPALLRANPGARLLAEPQTAAHLAQKGIEAEDLTTAGVFDVANVALHTLGDTHAVIHADMPLVDNVGVVVRAAGEPTLFHPGDALDADPGEIDVLATPIMAPWCAMKETVDFVRRLHPGRFVPIHDGLLNDAGRSLFVGQVAGLNPDSGLLDLAGAGAVEL